MGSIKTPIRSAMLISLTNDVCPRDSDSRAVPVQAFISPQRAPRTLRATSGAVSVLNIRGPSRMAEKPFFDASVVRASQATLRPNQQGNACGLIIQCTGCCLRVQHQLAVSLDVGQPLRQVVGSFTSGTMARPLCSQALMTICCQCSCFFCQRSGDRRTSTRWLRMGTMGDARLGSSLMAHSKRSPLDTAKARQVFNDDSVSASILSMSTDT